MKGSRLSPREEECLGWIAQGRDVPGTAVAMSLSEHTVRTYLKTARAKLDCVTVSQAIYKATVSGLFDHMPVSR